MARLPRLSVAAMPHLVIQRSHNAQSVFRDAADRAQYLTLLRQISHGNSVAVHAYGLLDDQVRLLATPSETKALSRMMQALGRQYGGYFNRRHSHRGSLWDGRFRATIVEPERYLLTCMRFVEESDEAASELVTSSAAHHLGYRVDPLVSIHSQYWKLGNTPFEREASYRRLLDQGLTSTERQQLIDAVMKSWPLGSELFLTEISTRTSRRVVPLRPGRPAIKTKMNSI